MTEYAVFRMRDHYGPAPMEDAWAIAAKTERRSYSCFA